MSGTHGSVFARLVAKDLYLARWAIVGSIVLGIATIAVTPTGRVAFYVGSVSFICVLILLNVLTVTLGISQERKEKVHLFALSLPISTTGYLASKVVSALLAFTVPLALIAAGTAAILRTTALPDGLVVLAALLEGWIFFYFAVFLGVALYADSPLWNGVVIVLGNLSISFLLPAVHAIPAVGENVSTDRVVWSPQVLAVLAGEIGLGLAALALFFALTVRRKVFV